jgi:hypothetical protein
MIIFLWLREPGIVADLGLSETVYDDQPFEAISHHHIIVANFDHLFGNIALCIFSS